MVQSRIVLSSALALLIGTGVARAQQSQAGAPAKLYNTTKQKLLDGKIVIGSSVRSYDPAMYCAMSTAGFDFLWIEMQHALITYLDAARMIAGCRQGTAIPFVRVPDATESEIQKATDIGILGIIVPTVETAEKAQAAVKWAKYPPFGGRSQGSGQAASVWGNNYRQTANDNVMVVIMIESPKGVENLEKIVAVPGIDVIFIGGGDLASFSGFRQGSPQYLALVNRIREITLKAGIKLGGPLTYKDKNMGFTFFEGGAANTEEDMIHLGAKVLLNGSYTLPKSDDRE